MKEKKMSDCLTISAVVTVIAVVLGAVFWLIRGGSSCKSKEPLPGKLELAGTYTSETAEKLEGSTKTEKERDFTRLCAA